MNDYKTAEYDIFVRGMKAIYGEAWRDRALRSFCIRRQKAEDAKIPGKPGS